MGSSFREVLGRRMHRRIPDGNCNLAAGMALEGACRSVARILQYSQVRGDLGDNPVDDDWVSAFACRHRMSRFCALLFVPATVRYSLIAFGG